MTDDPLEAVYRELAAERFRRYEPPADLAQRHRDEVAEHVAALRLVHTTSTVSPQESTTDVDEQGGAA